MRLHDPLGVHPNLDAASSSAQNAPKRSGEGGVRGNSLPEGCHWRVRSPLYPLTVKDRSLQCGFWLRSYQILIWILLWILGWTSRKKARKFHKRNPPCCGSQGGYQGKRPENSTKEIPRKTHLGPQSWDWAGQPEEPPRPIPQNCCGDCWWHCRGKSECWGECCGVVPGELPGTAGGTAGSSVGKILSDFCRSPSQTYGLLQKNKNLRNGLRARCCYPFSHSFGADSTDLLGVCQWSVDGLLVVC